MVESIMGKTCAKSFSILVSRSGDIILRFSIFSSSDHFVMQIRTICAISADSIIGNSEIGVILWNWTSGSGGDSFGEHFVQRRRIIRTILNARHAGQRPITIAHVKHKAQVSYQWVNF